MATLNTYTMLDSDLQRFANTVKDRLAEQLNLPDLNNYLVIVSSPSTWGNFVSTLKGLFAGDNKGDKDVTHILIVKSVYVEREKN